MISKNREQTYGCFGFRFLDGIVEPAVQIDNLGIELRTSTEYYFDGLNRNENGVYLFQYTISGWGIFSYEGKTIKVEEGQAFLAKIPSEHSYYLPEESKSWEFIYIVFYGREVDIRWDEILNCIGTVAKFEVDSPVIEMLFNIFREAAMDKIDDAFRLSGFAYQFFMELYRACKKDMRKELPPLIQQTIKKMRSEYAVIEGIDGISNSLGVSKYHLIRQFNKATGISPGKFLTKLKLEKAVELLGSTDLKIDEIARLVGYTNGNYFIKVFHKFFGISPGEYRVKNNRVIYTRVTM